MISTALLSMWISNTATTMMMLPIALAVARQFGEFFSLEAGDRRAKVEERKFGLALMLGIAYSASIGGMATLIGTPTNAIFSAVAKEYYNAEVSFSEWMKFGLPLSVILLFICWIYLTMIAFRPAFQRFSHASDTIDNELKKLGTIKTEEKRIIIVFGLTALAWITRSFLLARIIPAIDDTIIAICGALGIISYPCKEW